jgi:hypothetical protein
VSALWTATQRLRLHAELLLLRHGWWTAVSLALTVATVIAAVAAALHRHDQLDILQQRLNVLQAQQRASAKPGPIAPRAQPSPGEALWAVLPSEDTGSNQTQAIFKLARQHGLRVNQATYVPAHESHDPLQSVQITLPLGGTYPAVRRWALDLLQTMPNVSIDSLEMEREAPNLADLEIRGRLSIWQQSPTRIDALRRSASAARTRP